MIPDNDHNLYVFSFSEAVLNMSHVGSYILFYGVFFGRKLGYVFQTTDQAGLSPRNSVFDL